MQFFGDAIERANRGEDSRIGTRGPRSLLQLLPEEFTLEDAMRVRQREGLSNENNKCRNMVYQWVHRRFVLQLTVDSFKKAHNEV